jgi:hypothetical protein
LRQSLGPKWHKRQAIRKSKIFGKSVNASQETMIANCITFCYSLFMKTIPVPVRLDKFLQKALREGARRTPHKKQDLIRLTLRRHLQEVIEQEAVAKPTRRITNIEPWPRQVVERAYRRIGRDWNQIEEIATRAQGRPDFND